MRNRPAPKDIRITESRNQILAIYDFRMRVYLMSLTERERTMLLRLLPEQCLRDFSSLRGTLRQRTNIGVWPDGAA